MTHGISKIIGVNISILIICLVIIELLFGSWITSSGIKRINVLRNVEYSLNTEKLYASSVNPIKYRRDQYGLRGNYSEPSKIDILTIGGSATDQKYITEGQTWQDVLATDFIQGGRELSIVNAGLDGQSTYGHIKDFDLWFPEIPRLRARYVLAYVGVNDFFVTGISQNDDLEGAKTWKGIIKSKSALYNLYATIKGTYLASFKYPINHHKLDFGDLKWTSLSMQQNHDQLIAERLQAYGARLKVLIAKIHHFGATPIFVTQAAFMCKHKKGEILGAPETMVYDGKDINGLDFCFMKSFFDRITMAVCKEAKGICVDLANELELGEIDFYDYYHNTPEGSRKIGDFLYSRLRNIQ